MLTPNRVLFKARLDVVGTRPVHRSRSFPTDATCESASNPDPAEFRCIWLIRSLATDLRIRVSYERRAPLGLAGNFDALLLRFKCKKRLFVLLLPDDGNFVHNQLR
jgi:hypothetical protein